MKIKWLEGAERHRDQIADYIFEHFGEDRMDRYMDDVEDMAGLLCQYPNMGAIDPLFAGREKTYRSVIVGKLSKMVYYVDGETICIAAFWDCRQEPERTGS